MDNSYGGASSWTRRASDQGTYGAWGDPNHRGSTARHQPSRQQAHGHRSAFAHRSSLPQAVDQEQYVHAAGLQAQSIPGNPPWYMDAHGQQAYHYPDGRRQSSYPLGRRLEPYSDVSNPSLYPSTSVQEYHPSHQDPVSQQEIRRPFPHLPATMQSYTGVTSYPNMDTQAPLRTQINPSPALTFPMDSNAASNLRPPNRPSQARVPPEALMPQFKGFIAKTEDALALLGGILQGYITHAARRPHDKEKATCIASGHIFVYEENASGIKRWTDGLNWSPSRVVSPFLVYRELVEPFPSGSKKAARKSSKPLVNDPSEATDGRSTTPSFARDQLSPDEARRLCGSLIDSYGFKEGGLVKKTISLKWGTTYHHIVSYYTLEDAKAGVLQRPCQDPALMQHFPTPAIIDQLDKATLEPIKTALANEADTPPVAAYSQVSPSQYIQRYPQYAATNWSGNYNSPVPQPSQPPQVLAYRQPLPSGTEHAQLPTRSSRPNYPNIKESPTRPSNALPQRATVNRQAPSHYLADDSETMFKPDAEPAGGYAQQYAQPQPEFSELGPQHEYQSQTQSVLGKRQRELEYQDHQSQSNVRAALAGPDDSYELPNHYTEFQAPVHHPYSNYAIDPEPHIFEDDSGLAGVPDMSAYGISHIQNY